MHKQSRIEGYWGKNPQDQEYPWPQANDQPWEGQEFFLKKLEMIENRNPPDNYHRYRGFSICRICGCVNGSAEHETDGWLWPTGFRHYVDEHNVRPSNDFIQFVINHNLGRSRPW